MKYLALLVVSSVGFFTSYGNPSNADDGIKLHGRVFDFASHLPIHAEVNVILYYNSDFIKDDSCKTVNAEFTTSLNKFGWYMISLTAEGYMEITDTLVVLSGHRRGLKGITICPLRNQ